MTSKPQMPLYYQGKTLADMEASLRQNYLKQSGWLESAESKLALRGGKPVPWFTYAAISFLEREVPPHASIFEYGGGQSTIYWANRVQRVVSIDHDPSFEAHVNASLPGNACFTVIEEHAPLPPRLLPWAEHAPKWLDPERTPQTYRSGQLNLAFQSYALQILMHPANSFDLVVVDGMARSLSTWAAIQHFRRNGFIVFDNSDRDFYAPAYELLERAGYRRMDFWGMGPINPYEWCTSIFYQPANFHGTRWLAQPTRATSPGAPEGLGILVLGYNRPHHLQSVLESLRQQGQLDKVHVWIDGTQGRGEYLQANAHASRIALRFQVAELRVQNSHLGIEKMMLDALSDLSRKYDRLIVLEDDCFPTDTSVALFEEELSVVADWEDIYSVYGHPFQTEPEDDRNFSRFQGWGWAAHSHRIRALLPDLKALFMMSEDDYLLHITAHMTPEIRTRLDRTPGRNVLGVLQSFFSWDSATAFLCAEKGLYHRRTSQRCVINTGIIAGIGHFREDTQRLRSAPFNMIPLSEAWAHFDSTTKPCRAARDSYGLEGLDVLIRAALPPDPGFFIEIGAHDGVTQNNSMILEAVGWRGMLIEAIPAQYAKCVKARPQAIVEHAACVSADYPDSTLLISDVGLMSMGATSQMSEDKRTEWLARGEVFAKRPRQDIEVPVATLSGLLDKHAVLQVDLLILDVEGAEVDVLRGLDFIRHAPRFIVAEDAYDEEVAQFLARHGYTQQRILLKRKFTRDCLYVK